MVVSVASQVATKADYNSRLAGSNDKQFADFLVRFCASRTAERRAVHEARRAG